MNKLEEINISDLFVENLSVLKSMYRKVTEEAEKERAEQLIKDWDEWKSLDNKSKKFVLDYLKN